LCPSQFPATPMVTCIDCVDTPRWDGSVRKWYFYSALPLRFHSPISRLCSPVPILCLQIGIFLPEQVRTLTSVSPCLSPWGSCSLLNHGPPSPFSYAFGPNTHLLSALVSRHSAYTLSLPAIPRKRMLKCPCHSLGSKRLLPFAQAMPPMLRITLMVSPSPLMFSLSRLSSSEAAGSHPRGRVCPPVNDKCTFRLALSSSALRRPRGVSSTVGSFPPCTPSFTPAFSHPANIRIRHQLKPAYSFIPPTPLWKLCELSLFFPYQSPPFFYSFFS